MLLNRAKANTATTGTGTVTLGSAVSPYNTWANAGALTGQSYSYLIEDGTAWEIGTGVYSAGTLTRPGPSADPTFQSSSGALLALSGTATVSCSANRADFAVSLGGVVPGFRGALVKKSANSTTVNATTALAVAWDAEVYDTDNIHDNATNNTRLTVPVGVTQVRLSAQVYCDDFAYGATLYVNIRKNGVANFDGGAFATLNQSANSLERVATITTPILNVTPGDYFEVFITSPWDSSVTVYGTTVPSWFAMEVVQLPASGGVGGSDTVLLQRVNVTSSQAQVDLTAFDNAVYDEYVVEIINPVSSTGGEMRWFASSDGGATFDTGVNYTNQSYVQGSDGYAAADNRPGVAYGLVVQGGMNTASGNGMLTRMHIGDPSNTAYHKIILAENAGNSPGTIYRVGASSAWKSLSAMNAIRLVSNGGNITGGIFKLYGRRRTSAALAGGANNGTVFPSSPSTNDRFFRTDRGLEYFYNGTRWLTTEVFVDVHDHQLSGGANVTLPLPYGGAYDLWSEGIDLSGVVSTGTPASNYDTYSIAVYDNTTGTTLGTITTAGFGASGVWSLVTLATGTLAAKTNKIVYSTKVSTTGTPGSGQIRLRHRYRLVG